MHFSLCFPKHFSNYCNSWLIFCLVPYRLGTTKWNVVCMVSTIAQSSQPLSRLALTTKWKNWIHLLHSWAAVHRNDLMLLSHLTIWVRGSQSNWGQIIHAESLVQTYCRNCCSHWASVQRALKFSVFDRASAEQGIFSDNKMLHVPSQPSTQGCPRCTQRRWKTAAFGKSCKTARVVTLHHFSVR